jgi:PKD repeat protein
MEEFSQAPTPSSEPIPAVPAPEAPSPAPAAPAAPALDPKIKRKRMLKRLGIVSSVVFVLLLVFTVLWAAFLANTEFILFKYLPISQAGFNKFFYTLFNIQMGAVVIATMLAALYGLIRSLLVKKEELEQKKKFSRMALKFGIGFLLTGVLWLVGIWFLGPRLVEELRYGSPIVTVPENTIGLTSPISISFDASLIPIETSVYSILSYTWDFGDGSIANGQKVTHEYKQKAQGNGIYTVVLTVEYMDLKSGARFDYETSTEVVIENELTAASFVANPSSGEVPLTVNFDAGSSFDPDGEIVSYEWDFDEDGRYDDAVGEVVSYEFTQEGNYEVSLRVTDNNGESATTSQVIEAGSVGGLRAVITPPLGEGAVYFTDERYEFDGNLSQATEQKIVKFKWDMGDGTKLEGRSVKHTYEEVGSYQVVLTVLDADGNADESILDLEVVEEGTPPSASIKTSPAAVSGVVSGPVPLTVGFDASGSTDPEDDIVDYEWDFDGDGIVDDSGSKVSNTYGEVGSYEAMLVVTDAAGNTKESTVNIEVTAQGITAKLEATPSNGEVPLTVSFDASGSSYKEGSIVSYEIDFGDGADLYIGDATVTYKYNAVGTYTAVLTVVGADGARDSTEMQIVVRPVALTACFTVNESTGTGFLIVVVDPSCSQGTIDNYEWDFGDGEISFDRKPGSHTYDAPGTYTITLEITESTGIVDAFSKTVTVK